MNQLSAPMLGVIARGGAGPTGDAPAVTVTDPGSPTWANDLFRSRGAAGDAIVFVPDLERDPRIGQGTQLDELLPEQSPQVAVVPLPTHVTGVLAAIRDCAPRLQHRAEFIAAVRAHVASSYAGAWLKRVGKLESPSPSFGQHLGSWWPFHGGYFVTLQPTAEVRRRPEAAVPNAAAVRVLRTSSAPDRRVGERLCSAYAVQHQEVLGAPHRLAARWGLDRAVEYVVSPEPAALQLSPPDGRCPTCGDPVWAQCAFCHLTPPRLTHWMSVQVPGVAPVIPTAPVPPASPPPAQGQPPADPQPVKRAFQLPRARPAAPPADNPWLATGDRSPGDAR
ncbi:hypothetical protein GCM10011492_43400 [Flexivirga endophytica]|uniref:Uncharacterized protein n=1 Tax=Flexivirga endophytica TaxID=1849103 RepID=A0A916TIX5_9MICO|nr:hypothetical protein [Flexivirga endophytica]GGB47537.1 hypothetical protein GCM10011492_43400 [Flexivirga endophytica]GHB66964.1 hypothetical protein GCM10008112_39770 [Flexivirga endophytica]